MTQRSTPFDSERLLAVLQRHPNSPVYWVGFSGGADSTALLCALHELKPRLQAKIKVLHFNHGLHIDSDSWQKHCEFLCDELGIEFRAKRLSVNRASGAGIEAEARLVRYKAVENILGVGEFFLTAHHQDDQAETLLLNLVRGSGVDGLAGMPESRRIGNGLLVRPLLDFPMESLRQYLDLHQKNWLEDPSNDDQAFDRNFVRKSLLPLLSDRWPGVSERIARSSGLCRQASSTLATWAEQELTGHLLHPQILSLKNLSLADPAFSLLLRHWLRNNNAASLPARQLEELRNQCGRASAGNQVKISWHGWVMQLFQDSLWLQTESTICHCPELKWSEPGPLALGRGLGTLDIPYSADDWPKQLTVNRRLGGEKILVSKNGQNKDLKDILRVAGIPPWLRPSIPLLHGPESLLAVGDLVISQQLQDWLDEWNSRLSWQPSDPLLRHVHSQCGPATVDHSEAVS